MPDFQTMLDDLKKIASKQGGKDRLAIVARRFGIVGGRKWDEFFDDEIEILWRHTEGGVPLPTEPGPGMDAAAIERRCDDLGL